MKEAPVLQTHSDLAPETQSLMQLEGEFSHLHQVHQTQQQISSFQRLVLEMVVAVELMAPVEKLEEMVGQDVW
tara:strand:+ start:493 stop:711 length:219 start_codon:yes stop_codon:yes gene_type:complete